MKNLRGPNDPNLIQTNLCCLLGIIIQGILNPTPDLFAWSRPKCWSLLPGHLFLRRERYLVLSSNSGDVSANGNTKTLLPLLMFNQLVALHWLYQNQDCYWCQHQGQCYFWTDLISYIQWRQNGASSHLTRYALFLKRRNSAIFLKEEREWYWEPHLILCPALPDLRGFHGQN